MGAKTTALKRAAVGRETRRGASVPLIGGAIRRLRKQKGMSIQNLADASGVSVGMLSQIERDCANPSLRVITSIREALDVPVSSLFDEMPAATKDPDFVRRAANHPLLDLGSLRKKLLSPRDHRPLQFMVLELEPFATSGDKPVSYAAVKGGMVVEGQLVLCVGEEEALLHAGDSFLFDGARPHSFRNPRGVPVHIFWIIVTGGQERHL